MRLPTRYVVWLKLGASAVVPPTSVASVPLPAMAELPVQLNAPETSMLPLPVRVPPVMVRVVSVRPLFARSNVPPPTVNTVNPDSTVPVLNVSVLLLLMLVRLAKAVASPLAIPPKLSVVVPLLATMLAPTLVTGPVKVTMVVSQQPLLACVVPPTL